MNQFHRSRLTMGIMLVLSEIMIFLFYFIPFCKEVVHIQDELQYFVFLILAVFIYILVNIVAVNDDDVYLCKQFMTINFVITIIFTTIICKMYFLKEYASWRELLLYFLVDIAAVIPLLYLFIKRKLSINIKFSSGLLIILIIAFMCSLETFGKMFRWDASLYFKVYNDMPSTALFDFQQLTSYTHFSNGFSILVLLAKILLGNTGDAIRCVNIILYLSSICAFYFLIKKIIPSINKIDLYLASSLYASTPYLLGLVGNVSMDYPLACLYVILITFLFYKQDILASLFAWIFVFSKEPATILYASMILGFFLLDVFSYKEESFFFKIKNVFLNRKWIWINSVVIGIIWMLFFVKNGGAAFGGMIFEGGDTSFGFQIDFIKTKIVTMFTLNFNWVFIIGILIGLIYSLKTKKLKIFSVIVPVIFPGIVSIVFNCTFLTHIHPRYTIIDTLILIIIYTFVVESLLTNVRMRYITFVLLTFLLFVQNYKSIDFISNHLNPSFQISENETILSVPYETFSDSCVYNRQFSYFDDALDIAIQKILDKDKDSLILFPTGDIGSTGYQWTFGGVWSDDYPIYWDGEHRTLDTGELLNIEYIDHNSDLKQFLNSNYKTYYIAAPFLFKDINKMAENYNGVEISVINYRGWEVHIYDLWSN